MELRLVLRHQRWAPGPKVRTQSWRSLVPRGSGKPSRSEVTMAVLQPGAGLLSKALPTPHRPDCRLAAAQTPNKTQTGCYVLEIRIPETSTASPHEAWLEEPQALDAEPASLYPRREAFLIASDTWPRIPIPSRFTQMCRLLLASQGTAPHALGFPHTSASRHLLDPEANPAHPWASTQSAPRALPGCTTAWPFRARSPCRAWPCSCASGA